MLPATSFAPNAMNPIRLLALMAIFAFVSFAAVDPFMIETSLWPLIKVRTLSVLVMIVVLAVSATSVGRRYPTFLGCFIGSWTGMAVVILTEMTGGAASPYWTMVMLTFFTVALVLPMTVTQALLCFGSVAVFYNVWMVSQQATASTMNWAASNAGIWLSLLVSVAAVEFLRRVRLEQTASHNDLARLNETLRDEMAVREHAESLVLRSQQLDAVGRLAAGMAHELNNLLMVISGASESIRSGRGDMMRETKRIVDVAKRGGQLTSDLLRYARKGQRSDERFALSSVVKEVADTISTTHRDRVQVTREFTTATPWVSGDAALLRQVFLNLCLNGIDAMDGNGRLTLHSEVNAERKEVALSVIDEGKGMSEHELNHAFEPFFTTKPPGKGTGLGLAMAYGAIQDHQGEITFKTQIGRGTRVTVTLPLSEAPALITEEPVTMVPTSRGTRVLLVDDDDMVRAVLKDLLESSGMCITQASNGPDALDLLKRNIDEIDLVILDMIMPEMNGAEVFARLREFCPELPVVICSGFTQDDAMRQLVNAKHCSFLAKPFQALELVNMVLSLLGERSTSTGMDVAHQSPPELADDSTHTKI
jgi:signal transduction histidine kinase/CheY-like chemotaxis protein